MDCPYCFSDIANEAVVCKVCKRDLYLLKPLQARITELETELLEASKDQSDRALDEGKSSATLVDQPEEIHAKQTLKKVCVDIFIYLCVPFLILLAAHGVITIVYDTKMIYLRIISILVPLLFGYVLSENRYRKLWPWCVGVIFLSFASVIGMSSLTSLVDHSPILPQTVFDWRELLEYAVSIFFSYLTGILLGMTAYATKHPDKAERASPVVKLIARLLGKNGQSRTTKRGLFTKIETYGSALVTILSTIFAIYTGLKRFM